MNVEVLNPLMKLTIYLNNAKTNLLMTMSVYLR